MSVRKVMSKDGQLNPVDTWLTECLQRWCLTGSPRLAALNVCKANDAFWCSHICFPPWPHVLWVNAGPPRLNTGDPRYKWCAVRITMHTPTEADWWACNHACSQSRLASAARVFALRASAMETFTVSTNRTLTKQQWWKKYPHHPNMKIHIQYSMHMGFSEAMHACAQILKYKYFRIPLKVCLSVVLWLCGVTGPFPGCSQGLTRPWCPFMKCTLHQSHTQRSSDTAQTGCRVARKKKTHWPLFRGLGLPSWGSPLHGEICVVSVY